MLYVPAISRKMESAFFSERRKKLLTETFIFLQVEVGEDSDVYDFLTESEEQEFAKQVIS